MKSMTGFGQAKWRRGERALSVDVRSVNQRFFEAKLNMPREYLPWEAELRALVAAHVARGKVDVSVSRSGSVAGTATTMFVLPETMDRTSLRGGVRLLEQRLIRELHQP